MKNNINSIKEFWNVKAEKYGSSASATLSEIAVRYLEINEISKYIKNGYNVLDVGCGNGFTTRKLANRYDISILGVDYAQKMIDAANNGISISSRNSNNINFNVQDCTNLILEDEFFDIVYTERCIQNLPNIQLQEKGVKELIRVLKPGGKLLLIECSKNGLNKLNKIRKYIGRQPIKDAEPWHNKFLDDDWIINFVNENKHTKTIKINHFSSTYTFFTRVLPFWRLFYYSKWFYHIPNIGKLGYFKSYIIEKVGTD